MLLQNLKPGSMDKLGFSLDRLRKDYPALICCTISGYGDDGPYADRKAYDLLIQAESGLASITGGPEGPSRVGVSIVDIATGATAHAAILEALIARSRTGKGADIRISMFDVMADWLAVPLLNAEAGNPPQRMGLAHPSIAPYGVFRSKDGKDILISIQSEREWKKLCAEVLGQPDLPERSHALPTWSSASATGNSPTRRSATALRRMTRDDLLKRLSDADIAFAEVNTMADLAVHPHLRRIEVDTPNGVGDLSRARRHCRRRSRATMAPCPAIGEHIRERRHARSRCGPIVMTENSLKNSISTICGNGSAAPRKASDIVTAHLVKGLRATLFLEIGKPKDGRCGAVHRALVPGAAGGSDVASRARTAIPPAAASCRRCRCRAGCGPAANWNSSTPLRVGDDRDAHVDASRT